MCFLLQKFKSLLLKKASGPGDQSERNLPDIESSPEDKELIGSSFRAMHTIKGVRGMYSSGHVNEFRKREKFCLEIPGKSSNFKGIPAYSFLSLDPSSHYGAA